MIAKCEYNAKKREQRMIVVIPDATFNQFAFSQMEAMEIDILRKSRVMSDKLLLAERICRKVEQEQRRKKK